MNYFNILDIKSLPWWKLEFTRIYLIESVTFNKEFTTVGMQYNRYYC